MTAKIPIKKRSKTISLTADDLKVPVSPTHSKSEDENEEILTLRAQNKVLTEALKAVKESAAAQAKKNYDLAWYAKYRCKFF